MMAETNTSPAQITPGIHTVGQLAFPMLAALTEANETARAKRFRKLCSVHQKQRDLEAAELQQKEVAP